MANEKIVRLAMSMPGDLPDSEAVLRFVEDLISAGLRSWTYHVSDAVTGEFLGLYSGYGQRAVVVEAITEEHGTEQDQEQPSSSPPAAVDTGESDEDLLQLSRDLNASDNQPPEPGSGTSPQ